MEQFQKYHKIKIVGDIDNKGIFDNLDDEVVIQEKVDGCFNYNMKVNTDKGMIPIGEIVNKKMNIKILSQNPETKRLEYKKIKNYFKNGKGDKWVKIRYNFFGKDKYIIVTENHYVFTNNGLKQVKELNLNKDLFITSEPRLTKIQKEVLIGSLLGDCSFRNIGHPTKSPLYSETHSTKQINYLRYKKEILRNIISKEEIYYGRYSPEYKETEKIRIYSKSHGTLNQFKNFYEKNKKIIPKNIEDYLSTITLAFWYMDDGSCSFSDKQRPRAKFHTQGFGKIGVERLSVALNNLGIKNTPHNYKGWQIDVSTEGTEELFKIISPFIETTMRYKLPKEYWVNGPDLSKFIEERENCKILSIKSVSPKNKQRYDLEIEDNHNYFVKGILVHNSNFRFMVKDFKIIFGSRTQQLTSDEGEDTNVEKNFRRCIQHIRNKFEEVKDISPDLSHLIFFGENMVRHTINYNWETIPPFLGFDIYDLKKNKYLDYKDVKQIYSNLHLEMVPLIKICKVKEIGEINDSIVPISEYASLSSQDRLAEGVVIKNYGKQLFAKFVREKFKEKNKEVFGGSKKFANTDDEYFSAVYCTNARIDKCIFKLIDDGKTLGMEIMGDLLNMVYKDIWEENWQEISMSKKKIDLLNLKKIVSKRCLEVLKQSIINNSLQ